jgi:hypothetical protein
MADEQARAEARSVFQELMRKKEQERLPAQPTGNIGGSSTQPRRNHLGPHIVRLFSQAEKEAYKAHNKTTGRVALLEQLNELVGDKFPVWIMDSENHPLCAQLVAYLRQGSTYSLGRLKSSPQTAEVLDKILESEPAVRDSVCSLVDKYLRLESTPPEVEAKPARNSSGSRRRRGRALSRDKSKPRSSRSGSRKGKK